MYFIGTAWEDDEEDPLLVSDEVGQADNSTQVLAADSTNPEAIEANKLSGTFHSHYGIPNEEVVTEEKDLAEECTEKQIPEKPLPEEQQLKGMVEDNSVHVSGQDEGNEEEQQEEEEEQGAMKVNSKIERTQVRDRDSERDYRNRQRKRERHGDGREEERRRERERRERERRSTHGERPFLRNKFVNHRREETQGDWGKPVWDRRVHPMGKGPQVTLYQQSGIPQQGHRQHGFGQNRMGFHPQSRYQGNRYPQPQHEEHRERERERRRQREQRRDDERKEAASKVSERERERKRRDREHQESNQKNDRAREEAMEKERQRVQRKHREQEQQRARERRESETGRDRPRDGTGREASSVDSSEPRELPQKDLEKETSPSQGLGNVDALAKELPTRVQSKNSSKTGGGMFWPHNEMPMERWARDRNVGNNEGEDREEEGEKFREVVSIPLDSDNIPPLYTEMELRCMTTTMLSELMTKHGFTPQGKEDCIQALLAFSEAVQDFEAKQLEQTIERAYMPDIGQTISGDQTLYEWDRLVRLAQTGCAIDECLTDGHVSLFLEGIISQLPAKNFAIVSSIQVTLPTELFCICGTNSFLGRLQMKIPSTPILVKGGTAISITSM